MGHYKRSEIETKAKEKQATKDQSNVWGKHATANRTEINKMTPEQKTNYIMKGKK